MKFRIALTASLAAVLCAGCSRTRDPEWQPEAAMDHQFFPALVIATASVRPVEEDDEKAKKPDPYLLGDKFGLIGISIKTFSPNANVKVTIKENDVIAASTWSGKIPEANHHYYIVPKVNYKLDRLRKLSQQTSLKVDLAVEVNGKRLGNKAETLEVRSINDCPYGVAKSEEKVKHENSEDDFADLGWMFAAYVNEKHPYLDKLLQEAHDTKIADAFDGYRANDPVDVMKQVFAIWTALQKQGVQYTPVTPAPGGSLLVNSQFVRFPDQSGANMQATCTDGSVLFASILRKIGINPFLVVVPGHTYLGFYVNNSENEDEAEYVGLETTMIGASEIDEVAEDDMPTPLADLGQQLGNLGRSSKPWKSFAAAVTTATDDLDDKAEKLDAGGGYQTIDIAQARDEGIMPISFPTASP